MTERPKLRTKYIANQYGDIIDRYSMAELVEFGCDSSHALIIKRELDNLLKQELYSWHKDNKHIISMPESKLEYAYFACLYNDGRVKPKRGST